jgi:signal transduction histidine kinase
MQIGMGEPNDLNRSARGIPWTPEAKRRFDIEGAQRSAKSLAVVTAVCAVLFILWGLGDWEFFPEYAWLFMYYRIGAGVLCTVLAVLAVKLTDPNLKFAAMWLWFIVWGVANAAMIPATPQYVLSHTFVLVIAQWGSATFMFWHWKWGLTKSIALFLVGELAILQSGYVGFDVFSAHAYLATGVFLNVAFQKVKYDSAVNQYLTQIQLEDAKSSLEQAFDQLTQLDRVKSEFFANISHELRTPLTLILSPVDELLSKLRPSAERDALQVVRRNATRLLRMIDDLLDLARLEGGGLRLRVMQLDIAALTERTVGNAKPTAAAKRIDLQFCVEGVAPDMFGDPHRLEIILTNLIGNAMKFTPPDGRIDVRVFHNPAGTSIEVTDTGPGIPREERERIFDRFHQTETSERRQQGGVGIGLALARELAQLHGGSLTVDSQVEEGSTFTLFLMSGKGHFHTQIVERRQVQVDVHPGRRIEDRASALHTRPMEDATAELRQSQRPSERLLLDRGRVPRVLVAEDEADLRGFIVGVLKETYDVDSAGDGAEALALLKKNRPDLVLTDVMMPGTSGLDLCRAIKEDPSLQHIPVILLTARGESEAALEGYEAGADDFVSKPFHTKVLQARIRAHLKMRGLSLQLADQARLASAGTLAAGLAHEVKNPLNAAVNAVKVLEKGGSSRVSNERLMDIVIDALHRIDGVISALDAHARPADGTDLTPCNVRNAIESTLNLLEHKIRGRVTVHQDYETTGDVFAPARAFNQVLLNLVDNSIRSGAENIWIELRQADKQVSVAVADDGPGVPPDMVHRIFDPFFTTRVEGEGTGLGLHLSRRIAQECGGELRYEPRPGGGARFVMEIPAMEQAA